MAPYLAEKDFVNCSSEVFDISDFIVLNFSGSSAVNYLFARAARFR